ncbi:MAG: glycosyltransferase 87 family protein, partial [Planctomycetota bacterium]|nr:glycosyltransferase 87 family protein [Planctomycetota bacterium]
MTASPGAIYLSAASFARRQEAALATAARFVRSLTQPPVLTRVLIGVAAVVVLVQGYRAVFVRTNDYDVHLEYGRFFLEGEPFKSDGATAFYPLGRLWMNASFASIEYYTGRALCYVAAIVSLGVTLRMWGELAARAVPMAANKRTAAIGWTVAVLLPFIIRDLDECGLQLLLLFFLTSAGYAFAHGWKRLSGFWLGFAIVYKAAPLLFLPLLIWKREWRAAGWTIVFTIVLSTLPATYLGWQETGAAQRTWFSRAAGILRNQQAYPSAPGIEQPKPQNVSLKALIARYLRTYPPGHSLHVDHPLFFQFGRMSERVAAATVMGVVLALGAVIAWRMRRPWETPLANADFAPEWAVACLFVAIMSPLCWRQHLVMALPCAYLVARERLSATASTGWRKWVPVLAAIPFLC